MTKNQILHIIEGYNNNNFKQASLNVPVPSLFFPTEAQREENAALRLEVCALNTESAGGSSKKKKKNILHVMDCYNNNNFKLIPLKEVKNDSGEVKYYPPVAKEWKNTIYTFNLNSLKNLPLYDLNINFLIKSYFSSFFDHNFIHNRYIPGRSRRLSMNKIYVSKAEVKHTNSKAIITIYTYNREKLALLKKIKVFTPKKKNKVGFCLFHLYNFYKELKILNKIKLKIKPNTNFLLWSLSKMLSLSPKPYSTISPKPNSTISPKTFNLTKDFFSLAKKNGFTSDDFNSLIGGINSIIDKSIEKYPWLERPSKRFDKMCDSSIKDKDKDKNKDKDKDKDPSFIKGFISLIMFIKENINISELDLKGNLFPSPDLYKKYLHILLLLSAIPFIKYRLRLRLNKYKFEEKILYLLSSLISKYYNKKIEFNIVNMKSLILNSDIFTNILTLKLKKRKAHIVRLMNIILNRAVFPRVNRILEKSPEKKSVDFNLLENKYRNTSLTSILEVKQKRATLDKILNKIYHNVSLLSSLQYTLRRKLKKSQSVHSIQSVQQRMQQRLSKSRVSYKKVSKIVFNSIKYKNMGGIRLEVKGRLTKRYRADRALYKVKWKGGLKNIDSSYKRLSCMNKRGYLNPNVEYSIFTSKRRVGSYAVKGWISGK